MILKVENMHCSKCVERITKALESAKIKSNVNLNDKTVEVDDKDAIRAISELDDIGFDATEQTK